MTSGYSNITNEGQPEEITFLYKTSPGNMGKINFNKSDKIFNLKQKILKSVDLKNNQYLYFNGERLDDDKFVNFYEFDNQCVLDVIGELKGGMQIFVKNTEGKIYTFEVSQEETFSDLKMKLYEKSGISPRKMKLVYEGSVPNDITTLKQAKVENKSMINMIILPCDDMNVVLALKERNVDLGVQKSDKIIEVKEKIHKLFSINVRNQTLMLANVILDDRKTLGDYNINDNDEINLVLNSSTNKIIYIFLTLLILFLSFDLYKRLVLG